MNKFDPQIHHRRSIRLKGYDYSQEGLYFITKCCDDRKHRFGIIENNEMILNEFGTVAYIKLAKLPERFSNLELDVFQIMPNHIHGIIALAGAGFIPAQNDDRRSESQIGQRGGNRAPARGAPTGAPTTGDIEPSKSLATIGDIVGAYKSLVANECLSIWKLKWAGVTKEGGVNPVPNLGKLWQRNYYEHIIRSEESYQNISNYIINNPNKWEEDKMYQR